MTPYSKRTVLYISILITLFVTLPKLLSSRGEGILAQWVPFNGYDLLAQVTVCFCYCWTALLLYRKPHQYAQFRVVAQLGLLILFLCIGAGINNILFTKTFLFSGYLVRLLVAALLVWIVAKLCNSIYHTNELNRRNESLRFEYAQLELQVLRNQLDPHFFFNALNSMSGLIRENPANAQFYIAQMAQVFRYTLRARKDDMATLAEELENLYCYTNMMKMRYEDGFSLEVNLGQVSRDVKLPYLTLQTLMENALKHNLATKDCKLQVKLYVQPGKLVFSNNLQPKKEWEQRARTGLANLNKRYRILLDGELAIHRTAEHFNVELPVTKI